MRTITRGAAAGAGLIFHVFAQDSTSTSGAGKASVAFGSWSCRYIRNGEAISGAITPEDITTIGTYAAPTANTNIRIKAVDNTNMIGVYEVQIHADWVNTTNTCQSLTIYLTASGVAVLPVQIPLVAFDSQTATVSVGSGGITTSSFAAGAINAAAIAADAIGASELATDAVAEIADAIWDEARAGHVSAGSFGEGIASVQGNVTGSVGSVTGNVGGNVTGSVGSVAAGGITAASIATGAVDADALAADAVTEIWAGSTAPTSGAIADAVWDEARAGHVGAGSFGEGVVVASNSDKTGYSLTQAFPANFSSLAISVGGLVDADVEAINGTEVIGAGTALDLWRA
jgi:hypothetical protein